MELSPSRPAQNDSRTCQMNMLPKPSTLFQTRRASSASPVRGGNSFSFWSQGMQTPGWIAGCGPAFEADAGAAVAGLRGGRRDGAAAGVAARVHAELPGGLRHGPQVFDLVSFCMIAPASMM